MGPRLPLSRLREILVGVRTAAEETIKRFSHITAPRRRSHKTLQQLHQGDYPTRIYVVVTELLGARYFQYLVEQDLALDPSVAAAAESLDDAFDSCSRSARIEEPACASYLPKDSVARQALLDALERLRRVVAQYENAYDDLNDFQRRSVSESMQLDLWPDLALICQDLHDVRNALPHHTTEVCELCRTHDAKLCFSSRAAERDVYLLRVGMPEHATWAAVELSLSRNELQGASQQASLVRLQALCHLLESRWRDVYLRPGDRSFEAYIPSVAPIMTGLKVNMISLRHLLRDGAFFASIRQRERAGLALLIAYYYLHLSGTSLWPDSDIFPDVWFEAQESGIDLYRPFLSMRHPNTLPPTTGHEIFNNRDRPSLPALGKLLLEIWLGRSLQWDDVLAAAKSPKFCDDGLDTLFYLAVQRCWYTVSVRSRGQLTKGDSMYDEYASWVVKGLQYVLKFYQLYEKDVLGMLHKGQVPFSMRAAIVEARAEVLPIETRTAPDTSKENKQNTEVCVHEDGYQGLLDFKEYAGDVHVQFSLSDSDRRQTAANEWFYDLRTRVHPYLKQLRGNCTSTGVPEVKVAILDTGVFFKEILCSKHYGEQIAECRSWCDRADSPQAGDATSFENDLDGHGTQSAAVFMDVAPKAQLYVAKIFEGRQAKTNSSNNTANDVTRQRIANAIVYAADTWEVDIISMSFGYDARCSVIAQAIEYAAHRGVLLFASASNYGALRPVTFPASHCNVICIHAMTGKGIETDITTTGKLNSSNFATVGCAVRTYSVENRENVERYCSGSSIAAPIAAGIAACILEIMRCAQQAYLEKFLDEDKREMEYRRYDVAMRALKQKDGMEAVFSLIVGHTGLRGKYSFLAPATFLYAENVGHETTKIDTILRAIERR